MIAMLPLAGMGYVATNDKLVAAGIVGVPVILMCFAHLPFALMLLYALLPIEGAVQLSPYFTISKAVGVIVLLSFVPRAIGKPFILPTALKYIFGLAVWAIMSVIWAESPIFAALGLIGLILNIGLMVILINTIHDTRHFNLILLAVFVGAILASAMVTFGQVNYLSDQEDIGRVVLSEGTNPNILAAAILFGFLAGIYLFLHPSWIRKVLLLPFFPMMLFAILQTQSRTVLLTVVLAPLAGFALSLRGPKKMQHIMGIIGVCVIGYLLYFVVVNTSVLSREAQDRFRASGHNLQSSGRVEMWTRGLGFFLESPVLGWGWRNFAVRAGLQSKVASAHNSMIAMAAELGIVGFSLSVMFVGYMLIGCFRCTDPKLRWIGLTFLAFNFFVGMTSTTLLQKDFWYSLSFVLLATELGKRSQNAAPPPPQIMQSHLNTQALHTPLAMRRT